MLNNATRFFETKFLEFIAFRGRTTNYQWRVRLYNTLTPVVVVYGSETLAFQKLKATVYPSSEIRKLKDKKATIRTQLNEEGKAQ